jgi:hypothetical protein
MKSNINLEQYNKLSPFLLSLLSGTVNSMILHSVDECNESEDESEDELNNIVSDINKDWVFLDK